MFKKNDQLIYSPTDLVTFVSSPFASWANRLALEAPDSRLPVGEADELSGMLEKRGLALEESLINMLEAEGKKVRRLAGQNRNTTMQAMQEGEEVIFQAFLGSGNFQGYADFLIKVPGKSNLGDYHYEVIDTKLSLSSKPEFLIQLCCYAELLKLAQGRLPQKIHVCLGNAELESYRTEDFFYYYLALKHKFLQAQKEFSADSMPDPFDSKSYGNYSNFVEEFLQKADHLSQIANITRSQIKKLNQAQILTCEDLLNSELKQIPGIKAETFARLREQAKIQKDSQNVFPPLFRIKKHTPGEKAGLALLPPLSKSDVFFDIEGYPLCEGGLEYLWGCTYFDEGGNRQFKDFWAHDQQQEKEAFNEFINWVYQRWQLDPAMHIFHYASYEITACRKLMNRYGICEYEVDQLLRNEVFVDLYKVVKGALLLGEPRYSIKNVEHLYRGKRDTEVGTGGDSIVVYEEWQEKFKAGLEGGDWQSSGILSSIRDYNIDDCNSTQELAEWLSRQQDLHNIKYAGKTEVEEPEISEEVTERTCLRDKLLGMALQAENKERSRVTENLAWALEFHRREAKPIFWRLFDRLGLSAEELESDIDCLAGCQRTAREPFKPTARARNLAYEFRFSTDQEFKANVSSYYVLGQNDKKGNFLKATLLKKECDLEKGIIVVTSSCELPDEVTLVPDEFVRPDPIPQAITSFAQYYATEAACESAVNDFLQKKSPRITGRYDHEAPVVAAADPAERLKQTIDVVKRLDSSYLTIQGPPGAGKTYAGKHIISALLQDKKRIGISSNSHKAINNLLAGTARYCRQQGIAADFFCTRNTGEELAEAGVSVIKNSEISSLIGDCCVVGTTAWGFCRDDLQGCFDYLFIDEAGQVSVANLIGMSQSARNLVIMGDQMQLGQPSQANHPGESGMSILDYLMHDSPIIQPNMGIFLDTTYRMHSRVNDFISNAVYEGQLRSDPANDTQQIEVPEGYEGILNKSAGVIFVPVYHQGNTQASDEEVAEIKRLATELLGRTFVDKQGLKRVIDWSDLLFVAPYNHQVNKLKAGLGEQAKVGTVDKFQGQQAPVVFFSLCTSDASESPRGIGFLFDKHRLNVAVSRAQSMAILVGNPDLLCTPVASVEQMQNINLLTRAVF